MLCKDFPVGFMNYSLDNYKLGLKENYASLIANRKEISTAWINGRIGFFDPESEGSEPEICGKQRFYLVNIDQILNRNEDLNLTLADKPDIKLTLLLFSYERDYSTIELASSTYQALTSEAYEPPPDCLNFIYIDRIEVIAKHRKNGVGKHFLKKALNTLTTDLDIGFFVLKPMPLQRFAALEKDEWYELMEYDTLEQDEKKSLANLIKLYGSLGFRFVEGTDYMVCRTENFLEI